MIIVPKKTTLNRSAHAATTLKLTAARQRGTGMAEKFECQPGIADHQQILVVVRVAIPGR